MFMSPQVYGLLKQNLSKYLLAVTVDEPALMPPAVVENPEASKDADPASTEKGAAVDAGKGEDGAAGAGEKKSAKADPNGPKCVQLKMKPDWRKGSHKRRRGDLVAGNGGGAGRWAWPADRPEFCRFVLYKENSDTVSNRRERRRVRVGQREAVDVFDYGKLDDSFID